MNLGYLCEVCRFGKSIGIIWMLSESNLLDEREDDGLSSVIRAISFSLLVPYIDENFFLPRSNVGIKNICVCVITRTSS